MILRRGDKGQHVMILQASLQDSGIALPVYGVDGIFGPETELAVKQAQEMFLMDINGVADQKLFNVLGIPEISSTQLSATSKTSSVTTRWIMVGIAIGGIAFTIQKMRGI